MTPMLLEAMLKNLKMRWLHKSFALACENDAKFSILAYAVMLQEKTNMFVVALTNLSTRMMLQTFGHVLFHPFYSTK